MYFLFDLVISVLCTLKISVEWAIAAVLAAALIALFAMLIFI